MLKAANITVIMGLLLAGPLAVRPADAHDVAKPWLPLQLIEIGMTRDEVMALLGPPLFPRVLDHPPGCDVYMYNEGENALFAHIMYAWGRVEEFSDGHEITCVSFSLVIEEPK